MFMFGKFFSRVYAKISSLYALLPPIQGVSFSEWKKVRSYPGMISLAEKKALLLYSSKSRGPIVEFGSFLGASSYALAVGMQLNRDLSLLRPSLSVYDAFSSSLTHPFSKHVFTYCQQFSLDAFLEIRDGYVNWLPIVEKGLKRFSDKVKIVQVIVNNDLTIFPEMPSEIGLLHLDLPKDIRTLNQIAKHCFPRMVVGSIVIFQDYYYHYSSELIAFFEFLESSGVVVAETSVDTSVYYRVQESISPDVVDIFTSSGDVLHLLHQAVNRTLSSRVSKANKTAVVIAYIRAMLGSAEQPSADFALQKTIKNYLSVAIALDAASASLRLSEVMTEDLIPL